MNENGGSVQVLHIDGSKGWFEHLGFYRIEIYFGKPYSSSVQELSCV